MLHRSDFLRELKETFPELTKDINKQGGLLHFEMTVFSLFVEQQIKQKNQDIVLNCFQLADKFYRLGNSKLKNAIDVSFLEPLLILKTEKWAFDLLPQTSKQLFLAFHGESFLLKH
ncbi:DUF7674 family protein [Neisseria sp. Ec49-e6-T10]|uniref:DUF7674 family protein n=1 Tax=Neisseria sp. Ec49-e6-T10 TaxID=3140744 RepID=UPI003EBB185C